jgi:hypothetical protein
LRNRSITCRIREFSQAGDTALRAVQQLALKPPLRFRSDNHRNVDRALTLPIRQKTNSFLERPPAALRACRCSLAKNRLFHAMILFGLVLARASVSAAIAWQNKIYNVFLGGPTHLRPSCG